VAGREFQDAVFAKDFDRNLAVQKLILGAVHHTHATFADFRHDTKVAEGFPNHSLLLFPAMLACRFAGGQRKRRPGKDTQSV
jgi:hypothetical protein